MSFLVAKKSIENALKEFGTNQLHICFFGGEPLCNFDLIKKIVKYCQIWRVPRFLDTLSAA